MNEKITAVMVTGKTEERYELMELSIKSFLKQTYDNKELLIVNDGIKEIDISETNIHELYIEEDGLNLGQLRNIAKHSIKDGYTMLWADDDWHHPKLMEYQYQALDNYDFCLLNNQIRYSFQDELAWIHNSKGSGIPGTFLEKNNDHFFPKVERGEDSSYINRLKRTRKFICLDNSPHFFIRFFHGFNSWGRDHFDLDSKHELQKLPKDMWHNVNKIISKYKKKVSWL